MSNINLSLDDIIAKSKASKTTRGNKKQFKNGKPIERKTGGVKKIKNAMTGGALTKVIPTGRWLHDMFNSTVSTRTLGGPSLIIPVDSNKKVHLNISNLASTVTSSDLQELFSSYSFDSAVVHYGENGKHLGTGEVVMKKKDAEKAIIDFKGISIDGAPLRMAIIEGRDKAVTIFSRVQMVKKVGEGSIQKRSRESRAQQISGKKPAGHAPLKPLKRLNEKKAFKAGRGNISKGAKKPKSEKELDAELDSYMKKERMEQ